MASTTSQAQTDRARAFVQVLSCVLSRLVEANEAAADPGPVTKFHALRPPGISILDYCARIQRYASCSPECFVLALVYIDRLIQGNNILLTALNVHRIIITAVMLAAKFFDDHYFNNAYYAKVGGVPTSEVNSLELEFLFSINFSLSVPTDVYERYYSELANHMGLGVPEGYIASNTCECARHAPHIAYTVEEIEATGMREFEAIVAESLAAFGAQSGNVAPLVDGMSTMTVEDPHMMVENSIPLASSTSAYSAQGAGGGGMMVENDVVPTAWRDGPSRTDIDSCGDGNCPATGDAEVTSSDGSSSGLVDSSDAYARTAAPAPSSETGRNR